MSIRKQIEACSFDNDLSIDKFQLDQEALSHSVTYFRYAELLAHAKAELIAVEDALKLEMSNVNISTRNSFIKNDLKFTEAVISSEVEKAESVLDLREKVREASKNVGTLQAAVSAFEHRKSQIDNLVKLYVAGYFSAPTASGQAREAASNKKGSAVRKGLNSKRRDEDDE